MRERLNYSEEGTMTEGEGETERKWERKAETERERKKISYNLKENWQFFMKGDWKNEQMSEGVDV